MKHQVAFFFCCHFNMTKRPSSGLALWVWTAKCSRFLHRSQLRGSWFVRKFQDQLKTLCIIVQLHHKVIFTRMRKSKLLLKPTCVFSVSSQGRGRFRDGLHRTGQHDLGTAWRAHGPNGGPTKWDFCTRPDQRTWTVKITQTLPCPVQLLLAAPRQKNTNKQKNRKKNLNKELIQFKTSPLFLVPSHLKSLTFFVWGT